MKEKYKHLLNFVANVLTLAFETACFGWVWYMCYVPQMSKADVFFRRGNWAVIGFYAHAIDDHLMHTTHVIRGDSVHCSVGDSGPKGISAVVSAASDAGNLWKLFAG